MFSIETLNKRMSVRNRSLSLKERLKETSDKKLRALKQSAKRKLVHRLSGLKVTERFLNSEDVEIVGKGKKLTVPMLEQMELDEFEMLQYADDDILKRNLRYR